jgi:hypothetical protein
MSNHFSKNFNIIKERFPRVASLLDIADDGSIESVESNGGGPVPCFLQGEGRKLFIHSRIDPQREAERFIQEIDFSGRDLVVILGFGFGYHIEELLKKSGRGINILAVEKNPLF